MKTTNYVPTSVGPTKLEKVLSYCVQLTDENKEKVCIIQDIIKIGNLLGNPPITPSFFYRLYEMPIAILEAVQHNAQVEYNTYQYTARVNSSHL